MGQAGASSSCTAGRPGLNDKQPTPVQPSAPCHGGGREHLVNPAAAVGQPGAGSATKGWTLLLPGISLQAVLAGWAAVPGLLGLLGELEPGSGKNSRCRSAGP